MIQIQITLYWQAIGAVAVALLIFSWAYNFAITEHEKKHGYTTGKLTRLVIGGVLGTLGLLALVSWQVAVITLIAFAVAGPIMVLGENDRELARTQRKLEEESRKEAERLEAQRARVLEKTGE